MVWSGGGALNWLFPDPLIHASAVQVSAEVPLPSSMYGFVQRNASLQFSAPLKPYMRALDKLYCLLSFGIYYITDLQGLLQHSGAQRDTERERERERGREREREREREGERAALKSGWFFSPADPNILPEGTYSE
jgi:hypothetical protein